MFLKADVSYCCLILKLRKSSLRKMINDPRGLVNDQIKKQVLEGLKTIATRDSTLYTNGDLKDSVQLSTLEYFYSYVLNYCLTLKFV